MSSNIIKEGNNIIYENGEKCCFINVKELGINLNDTILSTLKIIILHC